MQPMTDEDEYAIERVIRAVIATATAKVFAEMLIEHLSRGLLDIYGLDFEAMTPEQRVKYTAIKVAALERLRVELPEKFRFAPPDDPNIRPGFDPDDE